MFFKKKFEVLFPVVARFWATLELNNKYSAEKGSLLAQLSKSSEHHKFPGGEVTIFSEEYKRAYLASYAFALLLLGCPSFSSITYHDAIKHGLAVC